MNSLSIDVVAHEHLASSDLGELRQLFEGEYLDDFEEREPHQLLGYVAEVLASRIG